MRYIHMYIHICICICVCVCALLMSMAAQDSPVSLMILPRFGPFFFSPTTSQRPRPSHLPSFFNEGAVFGATPQLYQAQWFRDVTLLRWLSMNHGHIALLHLNTVEFSFFSLD